MRDRLFGIRGGCARRAPFGGAWTSELRCDQAGMQGIRGVVARVDRRRGGFADAADSVADLDERILNAKSLMLRTVGFSIWQAHESELESSEDFERVHIARTIEQLVEQSAVIQRALAEDRLMITGARYQLDTGKVEVLSF